MPHEALRHPTLIRPSQFSVVSGIALDDIVEAARIAVLHEQGTTLRALRNKSVDEFDNMRMSQMMEQVYLSLEHLAIQADLLLNAVCSIISALDQVNAIIETTFLRHPCAI